MLTEKDQKEAEELEKQAAENAAKKKKLEEERRAANERVKQSYRLETKKKR